MVKKHKEITVQLYCRAGAELCYSISIQISNLTFIAESSFQTEILCIPLDFSTCLLTI